MSIKTWHETERPREKLLEHGASTLSDAELLAILLRTGTHGRSAVDLARQLLSEFGGLGKLMNATHTELSQHKGMGLATYAQFATVLEIGRRVLGEELRQQPILNTTQAVADYLRLRIGHERIEVSLALFLNQQNQLIACEELARGTVAEHTVYIREVAKLALQHHASAIIFAHNHPSGHAEASHNDRLFTNRLRAALVLLDIVLLDHFIITAEQVVSFVERGWLKS